MAHELKTPKCREAFRGSSKWWRRWESPSILVASRSENSRPLRKPFARITLAQPALRAGLLSVRLPRSQNKKPKYPVGTSVFYGGDGGSRTHVRKRSAAKLYMLISCFRLTESRPRATSSQPPQTLFSPPSRLRELESQPVSCRPIRETRLSPVRRHRLFIKQRERNCRLQLQFAVYLGGLRHLRMHLGFQHSRRSRVVPNGPSIAELEGGSSPPFSPPPPRAECPNPSG